VYGDDIGHIFLISAVIAVVGVLAAVLLPRIRLRSSVDLEPTAGSAPPQPAAASAAPQPAAASAARSGSQEGAGQPSDGIPYQGSHGVEPVPLPASPPPATGAVVTGHITGPDGRPVVGALLTVTDFPGHQVAREVSGPDGRYRLGLPSGGAYLLICAAQNHQPMATRLILNLGATRRDITLAGAGRVEGRIVGGAGEPVGGATVTLTDARGEVAGAAMTAADGGYALADLYPGDYTLVATADRRLPVARSVTVEGSGALRVDVTLRSNATVGGVIRSARTGQPVPDATATLTDAFGNVVGSATTGDDGRYEFPDLLPGFYTLTAGGFAPVTAPLELDSERTDQDVLLGQPVVAAVVGPTPRAGLENQAVRQDE
jgi:hypothetical protein